MSVTIVAMVNNTHQIASWNNATSDNDTCHIENDDANSTDTNNNVTTILFYTF